jgi:hypothetical protein
LDFLKNILGQAQWYIPVIPVLGRLRQEGLEFKVSLGYIDLVLKNILHTQ